MPKKQPEQAPDFMRKVDALTEVADALKRCRDIATCGDGDGSRYAGDERARGEAAVKAVLKNYSVIKEAADAAAGFGCDRDVWLIIMNEIRPAVEGEGWTNWKECRPHFWEPFEWCERTPICPAISPLEQVQQWEEKYREKAAGKGRPVAHGKAGSPTPWTKDHCPQCEHSGVTWLAVSAYCKQPGTLERRAVGTRVADGRYYSNDRRQVPWCETCKEITPIVRERASDSAHALRQAPRELEKAETDTLSTWAIEYVADLRGLLRRAEHDRNKPPAWVARPSTRVEREAVELLNVAVNAANTFAATNEDLPSREAVTAMMEAAIKRHRNAETRSLKMSTHNLKHRTVAREAEPRSGRVRRKPIDGKTD